MRAITKIRVKYSKKQDVRMMSHLDVISAVKNALDASGLPVCRRGAGKKICIAFGPPLPLGYTSCCELFDVEMLQRTEPEIVKQKLSEKMPPGFEIVSVYTVPVFSVPVDTAVNMAEYRILDMGDISGGDTKIKDFFSKKEYLIDRVTDKSVHTIDARPLVKEMNLNETGVSMMLRFGPKKTIKPDVLIQKVFSIGEELKASMKIERIAFYCETGDGALRSV